jgi:hypothetical protein
VHAESTLCSANGKDISKTKRSKLDLQGSMHFRNEDPIGSSFDQKPGRSATGGFAE